jgi:Fe-S-cluster containining protein
MSPFDKTTCACKECVALCKRQPGPLILGDLERIAAFRGETVEEAKRNFWASPGSLLKSLGSGEVTRVGTITPKWDRRKKRCVFLDDNDRCTVHPVKPAGCAYFDTHMNPDEAMERSLMAARLHQNPEYQALRDTLPYATHHNPAPVRHFNI